MHKAGPNAPSTRSLARPLKQARAFGQLAVRHGDARQPAGSRLSRAAAPVIGHAVASVHRRVNIAGPWQAHAWGLSGRGSCRGVGPVGAEGEVTQDVRGHRNTAFRGGEVKHACMRDSAGCGAQLKQLRAVFGCVPGA